MSRKSLITNTAMTDPNTSSRLVERQINNNTYMQMTGGFGLNVVTPITVTYGTPSSPYNTYANLSTGLITIPGPGVYYIQGQLNITVGALTRGVLVLEDLNNGVTGTLLDFAFSQAATTSTVTVGGYYYYPILPTQSVIDAVFLRVDSTPSGQTVSFNSASLLVVPQGIIAHAL